MAKNNGNALNVADLVRGTGALTCEEAATLGAQYRTADRAESMARVRKARIAYVLNKRNALDADGNAVLAVDVAKTWGVSGAALSQMADGYGRLVALGLDQESDAVQREAFVAADRIRKYGKTDAVKDAVSGVLADILALPVAERASALNAATGKGGAMTEAVAAAKKSTDNGTREANNTPETTGEKSAAGKADVLAALGSAVAAVDAADGVALTNSQADQVARYLAALVVGLGVSLDQVTDYVAENAAALAAA